MSSAFHHNDDGTYVVSKRGTNFVKYHEKIYQLNDGASSLEFDEHHHPLNAVKPIDVSITKECFFNAIIRCASPNSFWGSRKIC